MTTIKGTTKKGQAMIDRADYNEGFRLSDVYGKVSQAKENAWEYCYSLFCREDGAYNFRIISHNTFNFSVAWDIINQETGELMGVRIETANNSYFVLYPEFCR